MFKKMNKNKNKNNKVKLNNHNHNLNKFQRIFKINLLLFIKILHNVSHHKVNKQHNQ